VPDPTRLRLLVRIPSKALVSLLVLLLAGFPVAACGGDDKPKESKLEDPNPDNDRFHVGADATAFGGPAPLTIKFKAQPFHESGPVHYRWRFDDGTTSEERTPVKTFKEPGYYQVLMEARDAKGSDAWNLIVGAWPPEVWNARQGAEGPVSRRVLKKLQSAQGRRSAKRRREQLERSKRRAARYRSEPGT
jgi:hypothetical protein